MYYYIIIVCFYFVKIILFLDFSLKDFYQEIETDLIKKPRATLKVGVPALLFVIQNNLIFLALSKLDAATYQVTYQIKILTTAFFSVVLLGKKLNVYKWMALLLLTTGVALVQLEKNSKSDLKTSVEISSIDISKESADRFIAFLAILMACCLSGFAGVYFEKILKTSHVSLWMRNFQLG